MRPLMVLILNGLVRILFLWPYMWIIIAGKAKSDDIGKWKLPVPDFLSMDV